MNIQNFYKVLSYAYSLPDHYHSDTVLEETTITLIANHFPKKLLKHLTKQISAKSHVKTSRSPVEKRIPGLYDVHTEGIFPFPIQLIILPRLPYEEYLWLHCLHDDLSNAPLAELSNDYKIHKDDPMYQSVMNTIIRANITNKEEVAYMCEALYELFADELIRRESIGIAKGKSIGLTEGKSIGMTEGKSIGMTKGEQKFPALVLKLQADNRSSEILQAAKDSRYRASLYEEYEIA